MVVSDMQQLCNQVVSCFFGVPLGVYEPDEIREGMVPKDYGYVFKPVWPVQRLGISQVPGIVS